MLRRLTLLGGLIAALVLQPQIMSAETLSSGGALLFVRPNRAADPEPPSDGIRLPPSRPERPTPSPQPEPAPTMKPQSMAPQSVLPSERPNRRVDPNPPVKPRTNFPARNGAEANSQRSPVWKTFAKNFAACAPGCSPVQYNVWRHHDHGSCHSQGAAIDVFGMKCDDDGRTHMSINRAPRFESMVKCMRSKMPTLHRNGRHVTQGHHDHAHFSIGCFGGRRI